MLPVLAFEERWFPTQREVVRQACPCCGTFNSCKCEARGLEALELELDDERPESVVVETLSLW